MRAVSSRTTLRPEIDPVAPQQDMQPAITEPSSLLRQRPQLLAKIAVIAAPRMVADAGPLRVDDPARPPLADIEQGLEMRHRLASRLKWAMLAGQGISINVATDIPRLYKGGNRQEIIWLPDDMERFTAAAQEAERPWIVDGLRLAALTGLRLADLVSLTFDHIGEFAINRTALKTSRSKRLRVTIPLTGGLNDLLEELRARDRKPDVDTVLVNSSGRSWTERRVRRVVQHDPQHGSDRSRR